MKEAPRVGERDKGLVMKSGRRGGRRRRKRGRSLIKEYIARAGVASLPRRLLLPETKLPQNTPAERRIKKQLIFRAVE